jgi:hypothetical protein
VPVSAPYTLNQTLSAVRAGTCAVPILFAGKAKALDAAVRQADGEQWLGRVQDLGEEVRRQREGAEVLQHGGRVVWCKRQ